MSSYCKLIAVGNVTRDCELRFTPTGTAIAEIGLAINDRRKGANGEYVEKTTFLDVTFFGKTAETANEYATKGSQILVEGKLEQDNWTDKQSGAKRTKLKVVADRLVLLGSKEKRDEYHQPSPPNEGIDEPHSEPAPQTAEEVPF